MENDIAKMLTEDLISEILIRLPVISLMRSRCVCKAWFHLIDSRRFIDMHLKHSTTKTDRILISRSLEFCSNVVSVHDYESLDLVNSLELEPVLDYSSLVLCGPCNGIICLIDYDCNLVLYNPSIGVFVNIPPRPFPCRKDWFYNVKGIGFGSVSNPNHYKIIKLGTFCYVPPDDDDDDDDREDINHEVGEDNVGTDEEEGEENYENEDEPEPNDTVEIYDFSTNTWRQIECDCPYLIHDNQYGTLFKGALHWTSYSGWKKIILSFDMTTEVFRHLELPNEHLRENGTSKSLTVLNDSLGLFEYTNHNAFPEEQFIDIWVMREYGVARSWTKQVTVGPLAGINCPLMLWKNEAILLESIEGQLLSCTLDTNEIEEFEIDGMPGVMRAMVFQESLIPLSWCY